MSGYYALNEIYDLQMGKTPSRDNQKYWINGNYDWISIADLTKYGEYTGESKEKITQTAIEESGIRVIPSHTLIMSFKLSIGKVAITSRDCFSNEAIMAFIDKGVEKIIPEYAYYLFLAQDWGKGINRAVMGATLNKATLSKYRVHIHDEGTQREIICNLNKITNAINLRKRQIEEIDNLVKSQFIEMFEGEKYPDCPIKELVTGRVESVRKRYKPEDRIRYVDISSIDNKLNQMTGYTEYSLQEAPSRAQQCIEKGDILVSTVRPNLRNIAMNTFDDDHMVASSGFCVLRATTCNRSYLLAALLLDKFSRKMSELTTGANYPAIKDSDVLGYRIPRPPIERQNEFARFVEQTDKSKVLLAIELFFHLYTAICLKAFEKSSQMMYNHR